MSGKRHAERIRDLNFVPSSYLRLAELLNVNLWKL